MADDTIGAVEFSEAGDGLGRAQRQLWTAALLAGIVLGWLVLASTTIGEERRRPNGYRSYADSLQETARELRGSLETWRDRAGELLEQRDEIHARQVSAVNRANAAEQLAHEAQVREQVAISAAIGGPENPWARPSAEDNGQPAAAEEGAHGRD